MVSDKYAAREIVLTGSSDGNLYRQMIQPIILNLAKKKVKGTYSAPMALKAWENLVDRVVTDYRKKYGKYNDYIPYPLDAATKKLAAGGFMSTYSEEFRETVALLKAKESAKTKPKKTR